MDISQSYFALFGLPERFALDEAALSAAYQRIQGEVHPDRFASAGPADRRLAMQWATQANQAYRTLKSPLLRARYLCELHGIDLQVESNTRMPADFLITQMQWREALEEASESEDQGALEALEAGLQQSMMQTLREVAEAIDVHQDFDAAAQTTRCLMFLDKTREDIGRALDRLAS